MQQMMPGGPFSGMTAYGRMPMYGNMMRPGMHPSHAMPMGMPPNMMGMNMNAMGMNPMSMAALGMGMGMGMGMMPPNMYAAMAAANANNQAGAASSPGPSANGNQSASAGPASLAAAAAAAAGRPVVPPPPGAPTSNSSTSSTTASTQGSATGVRPPRPVVTQPTDLPAAFAQGDNMQQLVKQLSPDDKARMLTVWNQLHEKKIKQDEFLAKAQELLGPDNYRAVIESTGPSGLAGSPSASPRGSPAPGHPASNAASASIPLKRQLSIPPSGPMGPAAAASKKVRGPAARASSPGAGAVPPRTQTSPRQSPALGPPNVPQLSTTTTPAPPRAMASALGLSSTPTPAGRPPSRGTIGGDTPTAAPRQSIFAPSTTAAGTGRTAGGRQAAASADDDDLFNLAGVSLQDEEALLQSNSRFMEAHPYSGDESDPSRHELAALSKEQFFCSLEGVKAKMDSVCQLENLTASHSAYYYLTLALQERLTTLLAEMSRTSSHRSNRTLHNQFHLQRQQAMDATAQAQASSMLISATSAPATPAALKRRSMFAAETPQQQQQQQQQPSFYEVTLSSNVPSQLALLERHDRDLERAMLAAREAGAGAAHATAASSSPSNVNGTGGGAPVLPLDTTAPTAAASAGDAPPTKPRKEKPKLDSRNLSEGAATQRANATALKAVGGKVKSWMLPSAGGGGATSLSSPSATALNGPGADAMGPPASKRTASGGLAAATGVAGSTAAPTTVAGRKGRRGQRVPGVSGVPLKRIGMREAALVLESEIATGQGMWNETGVGKVTGRMWVRMKERPT
ncbi:hypothetical protein RI367_006235 [Sorochytrium milnesiophthora]